MAKSASPNHSVKDVGWTRLAQDSHPRRTSLGWRTLLWRLTASVAIFLLVAEAGLRVLDLGHSYESEADTYEKVSDSELLYTLRPSYRGYSEGTEVQVSSQGLRDREYSPTAPAGTVRIMMLGDSVTFGVGVRAEDTFSKRLEEQLEARGDGRSYEVINTGVPGYNTIQERARFEKIGLPLHPDLVVLTFVVNDLLDSYSIFDHAYAPTGFLAPVKQWLRRQVRLVRFYQNISWRITTAGRVDEQDVEPVRKRERVLEREAEVSRIAQLSQSQGAKFLLALYPDNLEQRISPDSDGNQPTVRDELLAFAQKQGYPALDLTAAIGDVRDQRSRVMRLKEDPHPSPIGHRALADSLLNAISSGGLLPL